MPDLRSASPHDLAAAFAQALAYDGRKRWRRADEIMAAIVAAELVDALDKAGFVVMRKPSSGGHSQLGHGAK